MSKAIHTTMATNGVFHSQMFGMGTDWPLNACISPYRTLIHVASSYKEAAESLSRTAVEGNAILDLVILPIAYLYRPYLELRIKDLIDIARRAEEEGEGYPKLHDLAKLWAEAMRLIHRHYGDRVGKIAAELQWIDECIHEWNEHDPSSFSFRYPTDKSGNITLSDMTHINLRNLHETMELVGSALDAISESVHYKLELLCEARMDYFHELRSYY